MRQVQKYPLVLVCVAVVLLVAGILLKPERKKPLQPQRSEVELARLQRLTQQQRLRELSDFLSDTADAVAPALVYLNAVQRSAVLVDGEGHAATTRLDAFAPARQRPLPAGVPFSVVDIDSRRAEPVIATRLPATGQWVLAIATTETGEPVYSYGLYQRAAESRCGTYSFEELRTTIPASSVVPGSAVANLAGELIGLACQCGDRHVIVSVASVRNAMRQEVSSDDRLQRDLGIRVVPAGDRVRIVSIWERRPAAHYGLEVGDELASADLDALLSGQPDQIAAVRRGRKVTLRLNNAPWEAHGLTLSPAREGVLVKAVAENSAAARAGIVPGDMVLGSLQATAKELAKSEPVLTLRRSTEEYRAVLAQ